MKFMFLKRASTWRSEGKTDYACAMTAGHIRLRDISEQIWSDGQLINKGFESICVFFLLIS